MAANNNSLGYVVVDDAEGQRGNIRGGALVVDFRGIPVDFRYTDPIRPTRIERIIYGSALDVYLREELILNSLLGSVETKPQLWLCSESGFLAPLRAARVRAAYIAQSSRSPLEAVGNVEPTAEQDVVMLQADAVSAPLRVAFPSGTRPDEVQQITKTLVDAAASMELLEPFGRVQQALASLDEKG